MEEDVLLIQCVEDFAYNCDDYSYVDLTGINTALTAFFMPFWSFTPLKEMLLKRFQRMRRMYMKLDVEYDKRTLLVQSLALKCDLMDGDDRSWKYGCREDMNWEGIQACLSDYFRSIGYEKIECKGSEEIIRFIHRLQSDVPLVGEYFKIVPRQDREIARVGYFGTKDEYEIYIEANDKGLLPHCHVRDWKTQGEQFETCIELRTNRYYPHGHYNDIFNSTEKTLWAEYTDNQSLFKPLRKACVNGSVWHIQNTNYEFIVEMWNKMNPDKVELVYQNEGVTDILIPDYQNLHR